MKRIITIFYFLSVFFNHGFAQLVLNFDNAKTSSKSMKQIHLIFIGDTNDDKIGHAMENNKNIYLNVFRDIAKTLNMKLTVTIVDGINYNKTIIQRTVDNTIPNKNILTFIILDGNGFRVTDENNSKHGRILGKTGAIMHQTEKTFHIEKDIFKPIHERNDSAFLVVIAEYSQDTISRYTYNSLYKLNYSSPKNYLSDTILYKNYSSNISFDNNYLSYKKEYLSNLFDENISAIYSSVSKGQFSWTISDHGIGLYSFLLGLQDVVSHENPTWEKVFNKAKELTHKNCKKAIGREMTPVFTIYKNTSDANIR